MFLVRATLSADMWRNSATSGQSEDPAPWSCLFRSYIDVPASNSIGSTKEVALSMYSDLWAVGTRVELALAELREIEATGPRFRIVHRFRRAGVHCQTGEEVTAIY